MEIQIEGRRGSSQQGGEDDPGPSESTPQIPPSDYKPLRLCALNESDSLTQQWNNCDRDLSFCIVQAQQAVLDLGDVVKYKFRPIEKRLLELKLRMHVWKMDCGVEDGCLENTRDLSQYIQDIFTTLHGHLETVAQKINEFHEDASKIVGASKSDRIEIDHNVNTSVDHITGLRTECEQMAGVFLELCEIQPLIQTVIALDGKGPLGEIRADILKLRKNYVTHDADPKTPQHSASSDIRREDELDNGQCPHCKRWFTFDIFGFHQDICSMARVPKDSESTGLLFATPSVSGPASESAGLFVRQLGEPDLQLQQRQQEGLSTTLGIDPWLPPDSDTSSISDSSTDTIFSSWDAASAVSSLDSNLTTSSWAEPSALSGRILSSISGSIRQILQDGNTSQSSIHVEQVGTTVQHRTYYNIGGKENGSDTDDDNSTIYAIGSLTQLLTSLLITIIVDKLPFSQETRHERYRTLREGFSNPWDTKFTTLFNKFSHNKMEDLPQNPTLWHILVHFNSLPPMSHTLLGPDGTSLMSKESFLKVAPHLTKITYGNIQKDHIIYSSSNYILLGLLIEAITMEPLESVIEEHLFGPLGMTRTFLGAPHPSVTGIAPPYTISVDGRRIPAETTPYGVGDIVNAAFGGYSCCRDLAVLFRELMTCINDDNYQNIFNRDTIRNQLMRRVTLDSKTEDAFTIYGIRTTSDSSLMGIMSPNRLITKGIGSAYRLGTRKNGKQVPMYYLAGHIEGYSSCYYFIPKFSAFVIVLTNTTGVHDAADHISRLLLQEIFDLKHPQRGLPLRKRVDVLHMSSHSAIQGQKLLKKFTAKDSQQDVKGPVSIQLDGTYVNEDSELSIVIRPGSLLVGIIGTARNPTNQRLVQTQDMGLIRTGNYTIRLRPLSKVGFTLDRYDSSYGWRQLDLDLVVDKDTQKVIRLERRLKNSIDKFTRQGD